MKGTLKDYYITTGMIAQYWNENKYLTERGTNWNADKVGKKFKKILKCVEDTIGSKGSFEDIYRSENGETGSHFIFFDAGEIMDYKQKLQEASLSGYKELLKGKNLYVHADDYEMDVYDSLKYIFECCNKAGGVEWLTGNEIENVSKKLENLVPMCRSIDRLKEKLDKVNSENKESCKELDEVMLEFENSKRMVRDYMRLFYVKTRTGFYKKKIFMAQYYVKNGQIDCLREWIKKWAYVIDNVVLIYSKSKGMNLDIQNIIKVLLI